MGISGELAAGHAKIRFRKLKVFQIALHQAIFSRHLQLAHRCSSLAKLATQKVRFLHLFLLAESEFSDPLRIEGVENLTAQFQLATNSILERLISR